MTVNLCYARCGERAPKGRLYCKDCSGKVERGEMKFSHYGEFQRIIQTQKIGMDKDLLQPLNKDGIINKSFVQAHGTRRLQKETGMSEGEIRKEVEQYG